VQVVGVTTSFGTFVVPYAQDYLKMRNVETYALDSAFWVAFTASRFAWAAASRLVPPHYLIGLEMGCMLLRCVQTRAFRSHN
jgi:fucose permease